MPPAAATAVNNSRITASLSAESSSKWLCVGVIVLIHLAWSTFGERATVKSMYFVDINFPKSPSVKKSEPRIIYYHCKVKNAQEQVGLFDGSHSIIAAHMRGGDETDQPPYFSPLVVARAKFLFI